MFNIELIRNINSKIIEKLKNRNIDESFVKRIKESDEKVRSLMVIQQEFLNTRNQKSELIGKFIQSKNIDEVSKLKNEVLILKDSITEIDEKIKILKNKINADLEIIPNLYDDSVPFGTSEADNKVIKKFMEPTVFNFKPLHHVDLAEKNNLFLLKKAAEITGTRFVTYYDKGARLYRALQQFTLESNIKEGFIEVAPQCIINSNSLYGTGQLPKFSNDLFKLENTDYYLSPTAEVQLTNLYKNTIINKELLPILLTANTPCFRSEAGSAGRDTRGVIRLHQFQKTELVAITKPENSSAMHEKITRQAERILELLKLPYQRVLLCTFDLGFGSFKSFDLEVWLPSYNNYKEISSCSNCLDFQARRAKIKYKQNKNNFLCHTLNGSSLAIDRLWVAIIENYQMENGEIVVPEVLIPYMDGLKIIK